MPDIYQHDAATLIPALVSQLPHSVTLLRRIQHGLAFPSETAQLLATFPPGTNPATPWLAARVDLFRGRETQMFIYSSLEAEHTSIQPIDAVTAKLSVDSSQSTNNNSDNSRSFTVASFSAPQSTLDAGRAQLLALLSYVKIHLLPVYLSSLHREQSATATAEGQISSVASSKTIPVNHGVPLIPAPDPRAFLIGGFHTGLLMLLQRSGTYTIADPLPNIRVHRFDNPPYYKYFFRRSDFGPESRSSGSASLPVGYRFHDREGREGVHSRHLDLVQSRTSIPRPRGQLATMPGVAIYRDESTGTDADEEPIAWGFLGVDGSVATLHVEPDHRGRGLAVPLSREIICRGMVPDGLFGPGTFEFDSQTQDLAAAWGHSDVSAGNSASRRVMEKLGGQVLTTITWTVVELCD
ncbi:unnamed protein product [Penicillium olsonii]|uniref:N-acetyltransferase domain-containing protein n=1 Tax=Penicillium olsonii TaxID=99116 RepID=A0A9W4MTZ8_PENOL|nr:unnamed protein product [Penicillium olsonii]CAG8100535.1 unnamed protein product [Penicillium olsonii]